MTSKPTCFDIPESLETVWDALSDFRAGQLPEGDSDNDSRWDDICTAMVWITEALGLPTGADADRPETAPPSTDDLADEYDAWLTVNLPHAARDELPSSGRMSADELIAELQADDCPDNAPLIAWLRDFCRRWEEAQALEDFNAAIAARGER